MPAFRRAVHRQRGAGATLEGVADTWKELIDSVNAMPSNLTEQVRSIAEVTEADATRLSTSVETSMADVAEHVGGTATRVADHQLLAATTAAKDSRQQSGPPLGGTRVNGNAGVDVLSKHLLYPLKGLPGNVLFLMVLPQDQPLVLRFLLSNVPHLAVFQDSLGLGPAPDVRSGIGGMLEDAPDRMVRRQSYRHATGSGSPYTLALCYNRTWRGASDAVSLTFAPMQPVGRHGIGFS